jgi:hypothetical protein
VVPLRVVPLRVVPLRVVPLRVVPLRLPPLRDFPLRERDPLLLEREPPRRDDPERDELRRDPPRELRLPSSSMPPPSIEPSSMSSSEPPFRSLSLKHGMIASLVDADEMGRNLQNLPRRHAPAPNRVSAQLTCQHRPRARRADALLRLLVRASGALDALLLARCAADVARRAAHALAAAGSAAPAGIAIECARVLLTASLVFSAAGLIRLRRWGAVLSLIQLPVRVFLVVAGFEPLLFGFEPLLELAPILPPRSGARLILIGGIAALEVARAAALVVAWRRGALHREKFTVQ